MKKPYIELLKDPRWQKKRLEIFERDKWTCTECLSKDHTLHVHHLRYEYGKMPWEAIDDDLTTLCEGCHHLEESLKLDVVVNNFAKAMSVTRIRLWRVIGALGYLKSTDPQVYTSIIDTLNEKAIAPNEPEYYKYLTETLNGNG